ncbi:hypothetical protein [Streptomyces venezuelae]|uniref:hypothetical protein n=1 Tax=Streptomyces venezuelae TaxID=54571 RepID=UPI00123B74A5|nr:hypothetical protein [Streptomyces venezuelae]
MSGTRYALTRALAVGCVVLLALFAPGTAWSATGAAEPRTASSAPAEPSAPAEGQSDPALDPELRTAVRGAARGTVPVRRPPVQGAWAAVVPAARGLSYDRLEPGAPRWAVRGVVLRC